MATISLYAGRINRMPGLLNEMRAAVEGYKIELTALERQVLCVDSSVCDLSSVQSSIHASIQIQLGLLMLLKALSGDSEYYVDGTSRIDNAIAQLLLRTKESFYQLYEYLKPTEERSPLAMLCGTGAAADSWCKRYWSAMLTSVYGMMAGSLLGAIADVLDIDPKDLYPDKNTKTFDDDKNNGTYGSDQGDMAHHKKGLWFFGFRWFEDEDLYAYARTHERYQDYSQTEIAHLMDQINEEGCGYAAVVNDIFVEYEGREEEFERVFGFPMYDKNGKANYDYLMLDFYAETDDLYFLDEPQGATALANDIIQLYKGKEDEFREKYGCDPIVTVDGVDYLSADAIQAILDEYSDVSEASVAVDGTSTYTLENRFNHYMDQKGLSYTVDTVMDGRTLSEEELQGYFSEGKSVNISVGGFDLYNEKGRRVQADVGNHWMTITGMTDDGRYIVSSWGERYYLNPEELDNPSFFIVDVGSE